MKTSTIIRLVGLTTLIFGAFGAILDLAELIVLSLNPDIYEDWTSDLIQWSQSSSIIGLILNSFWVVAGIYFLSRKRFALRLMYLALILSLLYGVAIGMLIPQPIPRSPSIIIQWLPIIAGIGVDLLLLFAVIKVTPTYHDPDMDKEGKGSVSIIRARTLIASSTLLFQVILFGLWVIVSEMTNSHQEAVALYDSILPFGLAKISTYLGFFLGATAFFLSIWNLSGNVGKLRMWNLIILSISAPLTLLHLWGLM